MSFAPSAGHRRSAQNLPKRIWWYCRSWLAGPIVHLLRKRAPRIAILPSGPLLVIAPHPDDESIGSGGLIALKRSRGETVRVVVLTSGQGSLPGHPAMKPADLAELRRCEVIAAVRELGAEDTDLVSLGACDGSLAFLTQPDRAALISVLVNLIHEIRPTIVATTFRFDDTPDHETAYALTSEAVRLAGHSLQIWEYPLWALWMTPCSKLRQPAFQRFERLDIRGVLAAKRRAIACHTTQVAPVSPYRRPTLSPRLVRRLLHSDELFLRTEFKK